PASDLYSLGVIAYQCLSGSNPFESDNFIATMFQHMHKIPESLRAVAPVPTELDELVLKLLSKDPAARPASASVLRHQLATLEAQLPVSDERARLARSRRTHRLISLSRIRHGPPHLPSPVIRSRALAALVVIALLAIAGIIG